MDKNESQDHAQAKVGDLIDLILRWWYRPSRKDLKDRNAFLEGEVQRLTEKCALRGDENAALQAQLAALNEEIEAARRAYRGIRRDVPHQIHQGKDPAAVHEARREFENNRLRVFVNSAHRSATALLDAIANLNRDLQTAKTAVAGGLMPETPANPG